MSKGKAQLNEVQRKKVAAVDLSNVDCLDSGVKQGGWMTAPAPNLTNLFTFYLAYLLAAAFGQWLLVNPEFQVTVWPPNGVMLAMLITQPRRTWPWWLGCGTLFYQKSN